MTFPLVGLLDQNNLLTMGAEGPLASQHQFIVHAKKCSFMRKGNRCKPLAISPQPADLSRLDRRFHDIISNPAALNAGVSLNLSWSLATQDFAGYSI
jgi:hypothetical protein